MTMMVLQALLLVVVGSDLDFVHLGPRGKRAGLGFPGKAAAAVATAVAQPLAVVNLLETMAGEEFFSELNC